MDVSILLCPRTSNLSVTMLMLPAFPVIADKLEMLDSSSSFKCWACMVNDPAFPAPVLLKSIEDSDNVISLILSVRFGPLPLAKNQDSSGTAKASS